MPTKYCIGVDFGTLSARAAAGGRGGRAASWPTATLDYPHAVMDERLPDGTRLKPDWALQHPQDYLDTLSFTVNEVLREIWRGRIGRGRYRRSTLPPVP